MVGTEPDPATSFGNFTDVTGVIAAGSQAEVQANITKLLDLIQNPDLALPQTARGAPFDMMDGITAHQLRFEITKLGEAIAAAPAV